MHIMLGMQIAPEVVEVERDAKSHSITMSDVLRAAKVNPTTWWRWRNAGIDPQLGTLRRVRHELDARISASREAA